MKPKTKIVSLAKKQALPKSKNAMSVTANEFAHLMAGFEPLSKNLALAVSGGPDSMALAFCIKRWREGKTRGTEKVVGFIVDHGLREGSAKEAGQVRGLLKGLGFEAHILHWQHPPVTTRLHEVARKARYALLRDACLTHGIDTLLLGHQREDQAETILMRFAKGSGIDGLGGMKSQSEMDGLRLLRPFLDIPRARLAATCMAARLPFISDPSNVSEKFARGRLRRVMPYLEKEGFAIERLIDLGIRASEAREALDHYAEKLLRVAGKMDAAGVIRLDLEHLRAAPEAIRERAFGASLRVISGEDYTPERSSLMDLLRALCRDSPMPSRTLQGCLISKDKELAVIMREFAAVTDLKTIGPGQAVIWDQRWRVMLEKKAAPKGNFEIRALGNPPHAILDALAPDLCRVVPQGRARASIPSLWRNGKLALIASLPETKSKNVAKATLLSLWPPQIGGTRTGW